MIRNYLKIALRSLLKNKAFTFINIFGLFVGLTAFLLIYSYVDFERSYDSFHPGADRMYRVTTDNVVNGVTGARDAMSFSPLGQAMADELPEVEQFTTTMKLYESIVFKKGDELINEAGIVAADERFLKMFPYPMKQGNPETAFSEPNSLVLTETSAMRLFGEPSPLGKTIDGLGVHQGVYKVTGILEDVPGNTHYKFDILLSFKTIEDRAREDGWRGYNFYTFIKLKEGVDVATVQAKMPAFPDKYLSPQATLEFTLQPLTDIHLTSGITYEPEITGNARTVSFLFIISVFIVSIAWVNYINLSTARAMDRAREVGLRKVVGAAKRQLITQFMLESFLVNLFGAILALTFVQLIGPAFNNLIGKPLIEAVWVSKSLVSLLAWLTVLGSILSGIYPALVLSSFKPIAVLKGKLRNSRQGLLLRKGLVIFQFVASLILIAGTVIVYLQIQYMKSRDLGVDLDHVITMKVPSYEEEEVAAYDRIYETVRTELLKSPGVENFATASSVPGGGTSNIASSSGGLSIVGETPINQSTVYTTTIDEFFFPTMGITFISGRNFTDNRPVEEQNAIVNQAVLDRLGFPDAEAALNKKLRFGDENSDRIYTIVGVVNNYNRRSLKNDIEPTVYLMGYYSFMTNLVVKLSGDNLSNSIDIVKAQWEQQFPNAPFEFRFMDEQFDEAYKEDQQFGSIFTSFSILAIAIAALGLFGLSSFVAVQRSKEIGVRKVLGAKVSGIIKLMFRDFVYLILIAFVIGSPLVYFVMNGWLDNYAFRIDLPLWVLPVAGIALFMVTFLTVGYQTAKAARANPVDTLRHE